MENIINNCNWEFDIYRDLAILGLDEAAKNDFLIF